MIPTETEPRAVLTRWVCVATMVFTALMGVGCGGPASPSPDDESPEATDAAVTRPASRRPLTDVDRSRLIQIVRQSSPLPGGPTVDAWVERKVATASGPLLYSDWAVLPGEDGVHEVTFSYKWRTSSFEILSEAMTWTVAEDTRVVTGPLEASPQGGPAQDEPRADEQPAAEPVAGTTEPFS